mgnify:CR=1 FL=1
MNFVVAKAEVRTNVRETLRRCGYFGLANRYTGQVGYVRRLSLSQHYPRFHLYINQETDQQYQFSLHLDQKQASYQGSRTHSADYDEDTVKAEMARILSILQS